MSKKKTRNYYVYGHIVRIPGHRRDGMVSRVGYTHNPEVREAQHKRDAAKEQDKKVSKKGQKSKSGWYFYNAIRKYGYEKFEMVILRKCATLNEALEWEDRLIRKHRTRVNQGGFNEIPGGQASPMSQSHVVQKMQRSLAIRWRDPKLRLAQGIKAKEVWSDPALRQRQSAVISEAWNDPDLKALRSTISRDVWKRPGYRSAACTKRREMWSDPERRRQHSSKITANWAENPGRRQEKSQLLSSMWQQDSYRASILKARAAQFADPEFKKRHREATAKAMRDPEIRLRTRLGRLEGAIRRQQRAIPEHLARGDQRKAKRARNLVKCYEKRLDLLRKLQKGLA